MAVPAAPPARLASPPLWDDEDLLAVEEEGSEEMMDVDGEVVEEGGSEVRTSESFEPSLHIEACRCIEACVDCDICLWSASAANDHLETPPRALKRRASSPPGECIAPLLLIR